jgi:hypothetical protein
LAGKQQWVTDLQPIPAVVIDKGVLKNVPYKSYQAGNYEINIYGDPERPAGLEIGVYNELLKSVKAKSNCIDFLAALLASSADQQLLRSLQLTKDSKERDGLTFEITPETDEDAYGGWWVSVYSKPLLDVGRASDEDLKGITVSWKEVEAAGQSRTAGASQSEEPSAGEDGLAGLELLSAKKSPKAASLNGPDGRPKTVYVHDYVRKKDGRYESSYMRRPKKQK